MANLPMASEKEATVTRPCRRKHGITAAEEALRKNEAQRSIETAPDALVIAEEGIIQSLTPAAERLLGYDSARVEVAVSDTRPSLNDKAGRQLLQPFVTKKPQGMGLGLSISRSITDAHEVRMEAGRKPERGVTFAFTVLVVERRATP